MKFKERRCLKKPSLAMAAKRSFRRKMEDGEAAVQQNETAASLLSSLSSTKAVFSKTFDREPSLARTPSGHQLLAMDWYCLEGGCGSINSAHRTSCVVCKTQRKSASEMNAVEKKRTYNVGNFSGNIQQGPAPARKTSAPPPVEKISLGGIWGAFTTALGMAADHIAGVDLEPASDTLHLRPPAAPPAQKKEKKKKGYRVDVEIDLTRQTMESFQKEEGEAFLHCLGQIAQVPVEDMSLDGYTPCNGGRGITARVSLGISTLAEAQALSELLSNTEDVSEFISSAMIAHLMEIADRRTYAAKSASAAMHW